MTGTASLTVTEQAVQGFYERFSYPNYPLLLSLRWQEGYYASQTFIAALDDGPQPRRSDLLIAGCGEVQPYIFAKQEPQRTRICCIDLAQRSLRRARFRSLWSFAKLEFHQASIESFCASRPASFDHIDSYGVIHHHEAPLVQLNHLSKALRPGGSLRLMVYNSAARHWILKLQQVFALCQLPSDDPAAITAAQQALQRWRLALPRLSCYLESLGPKTLGNPARFADTFFHPLEASIDWQQLSATCGKLGLNKIGIFDRYCELDDLPNPLWQAPTDEQMLARIADFRFENNFELYLKKKPHSDSAAPTERRKPQHRYRHFLRLCFKSPPKFWFRFSETQKIGLLTRRVVWLALLASLHLQRHQILRRRLLALPLPTLRRLARVGALTKQQARAFKMEQSLTAPLAAHMEAPKRPSNSTSSEAQSLEAAVISLLQKRGLPAELRAPIVEKLLSI